MVGEVSTYTRFSIYLLTVNKFEFVPFNPKVMSAHNFTSIKINEFLLPLRYYFVLFFLSCLFYHLSLIIVYCFVRY